MSGSPIRRAIVAGVVEIGIFSAAANILVLTVPLYLLQIYDRVLVSSSAETLIYISLMALAALAVLGVMEVVRAQYAARVAARVDAAIGTDVFLSAMEGQRAGLGDVQPLRDLATLRGFLSSRVLFFLFDLPFALLFIGLMWLIHPVLFAITLAGAALMVAVALANQLATSRSSRDAAETLGATMGLAQTFARSFETVRALGMVGNTVELWGGRFAASLAAADRVNKANAFWGGLSRTIRMILQIAMLGVGGWLVLGGEMTAGMIFASSIISGRVLQPLDQIIGAWRQIVEAARAWGRVATLPRMKQAGVDAGKLSLPAPQGAVRAEDVVYLPPDAGPNASPLIKRVSFDIGPGEMVAVTGPSQAGKSTLARLIVGAIRPFAGALRIDGAEIASWDRDELGRHVGYLPQEVELFPGTIAQNIARFDPEPADEAVVAAARRAHAHELVLRQKAGYATVIGPGGVRLSGGERQRIGLARALYGDPRLIVLDEPNAHLDAQGDAALEKAVLDARERGATVLIVTHRPAIAEKCDRILMLRDGQVELFGPAAEVLSRLAQERQRKDAVVAQDGAAPSSGAQFGQLIRVRAGRASA